MDNNAAARQLFYMAGGGTKRWTTAATTVTGTFKAIYICRNTQFTSITSTDITGATRISSKTSFTPPCIIQGAITKVKVKGGACFLIS